jgi:hypothetical protein
MASSRHVRKQFSFNTSHVHVFDNTEAYQIRRITFVAGSSVSGNLVVGHLASGNQNTAVELTHAVDADQTTVWSPIELWVNNGDQLILTTTIPADIEVTMELVPGV